MKLISNGFRPTYVSEVPDEILKLFAYDGKTDLIGGYHDRSGYARNPDWHGVYSEDSLTRVLELIKKGDRTVPEAVQKAIDEYFPNNVSNTYSNLKYITLFENHQKCQRLALTF